MKNISSFFVLVCLFVMISCGDKAMKGLPVPSDVTSVIHLNGNAMSSKASWQELDIINWFSKQANIGNDSARFNLLSDPEQSGVDIKSDFIIFNRRRSNVSYNVFEGFLKDADAFEKVVQKISVSDIEKKDGFKVLKIREGKMLSWNQSKFILVSGQAINNVRTNRNRPQQEFILPSDSLTAFANSLYDLSEEQSLGKNNSYASLLKENADVHIWTNTTVSLSGMGIGPLALLSASPLMQGNYSTTTFNFENGKVVGTFRQYFGDALSRVMEKHEAKNLTSDFFNRLPSKDPAGVLASNFNPETIREFFTAAGINPDSYLKPYNTSLDQIINATNGQMLLCLSPLTRKKAVDLNNPLSMIPMPLDINAFIAVSVKDKASFDQLVNILKDLFIGERSSQIPIPYKMNNEWFAIGTSTKQVDSFMMGMNNSHPFAERISGDPVGGFIDIQKLVGAAPADMVDSSQIALTRNTFQDMTIKGGRYKDHSMSFHAEINFVDKSTNSLKQLGKFVSGMRALEDQKSEKENKTAFIK